MSSVVVDQFEIDRRIATCPCHVVSPAQHVPSFWTRAITACVETCRGGLPGQDVIYPKAYVLSGFTQDDA